MVENRAISNENEKQERNIQCFIYTANQSFDSKHLKAYDVHLIFRKHSASSFFLFQWGHLRYSLFFFFILFYFIFKVYNIVLVLPNIEMNLPQVYMCSPSWTLLPPPSPYHPSGSSQCTSPKHPVSCIKRGLATHFIHDIINAILPNLPTLPLSHRVHKNVL